MNKTIFLEWANILLEYLNFDHTIWSTYWDIISFWSPTLHFHWYLQLLIFLRFHHMFILFLRLFFLNCISDLSRKVVIVLSNERHPLSVPLLMCYSYLTFSFSVSREFCFSLLIERQFSCSHNSKLIAISQQRFEVMISLSSGICL